MTRDEFVATILMLGAHPLESERHKLNPEAFKLILSSGDEINLYIKGDVVFFAGWKISTQALESLVGLESYVSYPFQTLIDHLVTMLENYDEHRANT